VSNVARTILVTGFEPFGGETLNASWEAAQRLEGWRFGDYTAAARLLPCAYDASVKELVKAIEALRPEAIVMAGQAGRRAVITVERFARNLDDSSAPDNAGVLRRAIRISAAGPDRLEATTSVTAIVHAIRAAGIPVRVSRNAGAFVCNHLYFGALEHLRSLKRPIPAVFMHLPITPEQTAKVARARPLAAATAAEALRTAAATMLKVSESSETA
jgi:pyroglutamyl-peptidase